MRSLLGPGVVALALAAGPAVAQQHRSAVEVIGFGDFNFFVTERPVPDGFRSGQLAGHVGAALTPRLGIFAEVTASPVATASFNLEIERSILRYDFADYLKLSAGRYHTPMGYWNTAFHHGQWLQTSVNRPEMVKFGGQFLPVHFVGLLAEGSLGSGGLAVRYHAGVGNGRGTNIARGGDAGDANAQRAWVAGVSVSPGTPRSLAIGAGIYTDRARPAVGASVDERMFDAFLAWTTERPEVIAEYARSRHEQDAGPRATSEAGYAQVAYRLPGPASAWKPYARYERVKVPATDPLLGTLGLNYRAVLAGVRYDFAPVAALKAEYRREKPGGAVWFETVVLQVSFTFPRWQEEQASSPEVNP
ncbi:MAG TPA: porin [Gemmatimonadales bacterium]|jgi:hypothetical protein|nr:porin [Gemmatimonadales bacterium]